MEEAETPPSLDSLAQAVGLSPYHFHRLFKKTTGITPKAYASAYRAQKTRHLLPESGSVTEALYEAGFNASSRFYAASTAMLGMAPRQYRAGGTGEVIQFGVGDCHLGAILVAASTEGPNIKGICAISLGDQPDLLVQDLQKRFPKAELTAEGLSESPFNQWLATVIGFVETPQFGLDLPLDIRGTAFQQRVWHALCAIPYGETRSYSDIARAIGAPKAARAIAKACASNPLALAIPCHRVVRQDGALSGYRWGVARKRCLLAREQNS